MCEILVRAHTSVINSAVKFHRSDGEPPDLFPNAALLRHNRQHGRMEVIVSDAICLEHATDGRNVDYAYHRHTHMSSAATAPTTNPREKYWKV